ncbi:MAG: sulfite exporter TauE/SafE family protein [Chitinophagaceae bacterium]|nr:sulfite exporter TauE/SafE family protein [Xanthomonadales bacterium]
MWVALTGAILIGITLGLLGSGGSILTVPVLVYLVGQPEKLAIAGSLAIVGGIALAGAVPRMLRREVDWRSVVWFGIPGMVGTFAGSTISKYVPGILQLFIFALVMLIAAVLMFRPSRRRPASLAPRARHRIVIDGLAVGVMTGLVGIGGGFLILPALVLLGGLAMHRAVGTSLAIIALNAFSGFAKHASLVAAAGMTLDWKLIGLFIAVGAVGSQIGLRLANRLPQQRLRQVFAVFLVLMGVFIIVQTAPELLGIAGRPSASQ